jgi:hypothetical protein
MTFYEQYLSVWKSNLFKALTRIAEFNYYSAKAFYKYQLHRSHHRHKGPPLLVYQMGKVGSSSIMASLRSLGLDMPLYHPHILIKSRLDEIETKRKKYFRTERYSSLKRPWECQFLRKQIDCTLNSKKWKIVTLTREPIARNVSTFFENLEVIPLEYKKKYEVKSDYYDIEPIIVNDGDMEKLIPLFFERPKHDSPLDFFDIELKEIFGIDVFSNEFPKAKGYKIYENEKAQVLLIRLENLNSCAKQAFKEFLDIEDFTLINTNIGAEKIYASLYRKFKDTVVFPNSYIDKLYNSKYMRHFYSESEIDGFRSIWRRI